MDRPELIPIFSSDDIAAKLSELAQRISSDYYGRELILIGVLKGAFVFLSDLIRQLTLSVKIDFVGASSYGNSDSSSGSIRLTHEIKSDIKQKHVLVVEDIVDTGLTLDYIIDYLGTFNPESIRVCAFLDKMERRKTKTQIDYAGYEIEGGFLVGYGLDYAENYRNLQGIYRLKI